MLHVTRSNRAEVLADALAGLLRDPAGPPLAPEVVLVPSAAMGRWLSLALADRLGVCAHTRFEFPAGYLWELFRSVLPEVPETSPFDPERMAWRLMALTARLPREPRYAPVARYLAGGDDGRRWELARRVADCYARYLVYRPDWIARWQDEGGLLAGKRTRYGGASQPSPPPPSRRERGVEHPSPSGRREGDEGPSIATDEARGADDMWLAPLWRQVAAQPGGGFREDPRERFFAALADDPAARAALPPRLAMFGLPALPPLTLDLYARLAEFTDVHLFVEDPCAEFWGESVSGREALRRAGGQAPAELYLETGPALLASMGRPLRDFLDLLRQYPADESEDFAEPGEACALAVLQSDILHFRSRGGDDCPPLPLRADDASLTVQACYGPLREVEALHDWLLALFDAEPDLRPSDVAVLMPDVERYAAAVEAVLGAAPRERRIPFAIADRAARAGNPLADALFELLEMRHARFEASRVLDLLELSPVRRRLELDDEGFARIAGWVREAGVRWGLDAGDRARRGLPAEAAHTWRQGLDRLLLGYALPAGGERLFAGLLPVDAPQGQGARELGTLAEFVRDLADWLEEIAAPRPVAGWAQLLRRVRSRFLEAGDDEEADAARLGDALDGMVRAAAEAGFDGAVSCAVAAAALRERLEAAGGAAGFLGGGVSFARLAPLRGVPFQVVCVLGMDEGAYPRAARPPGFDLMRREWRRGDRDPRADDRHAFLQALLSARRRFYVSYCGADPRDAGSRPPSPLVSELLDAVRAGFTSAGGGDAAAQVLRRAPLQPFSADHFTPGGAHWSYAAEMCPPAAAARPPAFFARPLAEPGPEWRQVDLQSLCDFFANSSRFLLRRRLGIFLDGPEAPVEDREPFALGRFEDEEVRRRLLDAQAGGADPVPLLRAAGVLPHGAAGDAVLEEQARAARSFAARHAPALAAPLREPLEIDLELGPFRLAGRLDRLGASGRLVTAPRSLWARDRSDLWISHLALALARPEGVAPQSRWLGSEESLHLAPVADAESRLRELLELYWQGLSRPLPFFARAAWAYAELADGDEEKARAMAGRKWFGGYNQRAECDDPSHALAFGEGAPLPEEFFGLALRVLGPLRDALAAGERDAAA